MSDFIDCPDDIQDAAHLAAFNAALKELSVLFQKDSVGHMQICFLRAFTSAQEAYQSHEKSWKASLPEGASGWLDDKIGAVVAEALARCFYLGGEDFSFTVTGQALQVYARTCIALNAMTELDSMLEEDDSIFGDSCGKQVLQILSSR